MLARFKPSAIDSFYRAFIVFGVIVFAGFIASIGILLFFSVEAAGSFPGMMGRIVCWFDEVYFQYNLILLMVAVLMVPCATIFYIYGMRGEKWRRLKYELPQSILDDEKRCDELKTLIDNQFNIRNYIGSMVMLGIIVTLGCMIILLLKPMPISGDQCGVDYSRGANFLTLGPFMKWFVNGEPAYMNVLTDSLTAFQFGFLGAYVYFITHYVRSYFTLGLSPNTFVESSIRMIMGSILALVLSFFFFDPGDNIQQSSQISVSIPIISFFIGFFPRRGLLLLEKIASAFANSKSGMVLFNIDEKYTSTELSDLPGMSFSHEIRFAREGFDNIENLAKADATELAVRMGFSYRQLSAWIDQAQLMVHLGKDYRTFVDATGILELSELRHFYNEWKKSHNNQDPCEELANAMGAQFLSKLHIICQLVCTEPQKEIAA